MLLSIVVPCYNEQDSIDELLTSLERLVLPIEKEIIVVDDGSTDASKEVISRHPRVKLIEHDANRGKGAAIRTGIEKSSGELLLIQDADMEYFPDDIPALVEPILRDEADFVLGSRIRGTRESMSLSHLIGNLILSAATSILFAKLITDVMTGYKVFKRKVLQDSKPSAKGFEAETEIVARALDKGYRMKEVPIHYQYRRVGVSHIGWKQGVTSLGPLLRIRMHVLLALLIFALGFTFRCAGAWYATANNLELAPDAQDYLALGKDILRLSFTVPREPMLPLAAAFSFLIVGPSAGALRITTALLGSFVILASFKLGESIHSKTAGLLLAAMVAFDPFLIWNSTRGLREEMFSLFLVVLVWQVISNNRFNLRAGLIGGLLMAALILTKLEGTVIALAICIYVLWYSNIKGWRRPTRYVIVILVSAMATNLAWMFFSWVRFGNPLETTTVQGSWWYSYEFGAANRITAFDYLFGYHTIPQLASMWLRGVLRIATSPYGSLTPLGSIGLAFALLGFLYLFRSPRTLLMNLTTLLFTGTMAVFFGVSNGADFRLLYPIFPFLYSYLTVIIVAMKSFFERWDRPLISNGFSFAFPLTKSLQINLTPSHLWYFLFLFVIYYELSLSGSFLKTFPFSYLFGSPPTLRA